MLFGYFLHDAKSDNSFPLQGESRFCKPRFSAPQPQLRTATIKTFQGRFEVFQTSNQRTQATTSHNPIKSFFRLTAVSLPGRHTPCAFQPPLAAVFSALRRSHVAAATFCAALRRLFFGEKAAERPQDRSAFASLFAFAQIRLNLRKIDLVIRHTVLDGIRRHSTHAFAHSDADRHHAEV